MSTGRGAFIVIEGTDGSGKGTQFKLLAERLEHEGYSVETFDFPRYEEPSSYFVREYLNGRYGTINDVGPYAASLFYALDRFEAASRLRKALDEGKVVLANRYVGSSMAHQGAKFYHAEERRGYFIWLDNLEFEVLKIPRPTLSIVLRVPADVAQSLIDQKGSRQYTERKRDIHEADIAHLSKTVEVFDDLCQLFPRDFVRLDCARDNELMDIGTIGELVWQKIMPLLPKPPAEARTATAGTTSTTIQSTYISKNADGSYTITDKGRQFLEQAVTSVEGNVYAFNSTLDPTTIAAAMARLSRRGDDMRVTILDEFAGNAGKDEQLLHRVITAYGDDSVQQLTGLHLVVEKASNLLTKKLEWGRLASYLEQSTRYLYFDQKNSEGRYRYHVPDHFSPEVHKQYGAYMDQIFDHYSQMVHTLTNYLKANTTVPKEAQDAAWHSAIKAQACDAVRAVLPVATESTVGIYASGQALESLIMHLLSDPLPEARVTGQAMLEQARKVAPAFLERADLPDRGGAAVAYHANTRQGMNNLAKAYLPTNHTEPSPPVQLTDVWPRNELEVIPDMLYEHTDLPLQQIRNIVAAWPYDQKLTIFEAYVGERLNRRHRPGRALEKVHYSWDLLCDYGIFRDLQRHRMVDDLEWQALTPRYGYDLPKLIEDAGITEPFETCFDLSLRLHSLLQEAGYTLEAQYATLLGHKMRWKVTYNAREAFHLHELRTSPQGHPGYRKLVQAMHERVCEIHPLIGEAMKFVNEGEDPELTRLAAERYTQYKLQQLDKSTATPVE